MNKCYFCGKECGETVLTVSDKTSLPSELFREYMCAECSEAVHSALILLRTIIKKGSDMESREEILSHDFSTDMEPRNCGDCKHYFYFVGEAGCELDSTSYPELCENFTPDDE